MKTMTMPKLLVGLATLVAGFALFAGGPVAADSPDEIIKRAQPSLTATDPGRRAAGVEVMAEADNKKAAELILKCVLAEKDAVAGYRMANAIAKLKSDEAVDEIASTVVKWTRGQDLFPAYWVLSGVAMSQTAKGEALLKTCAVDSKSKEIYLKAAALEAVGETKRKELGYIVADVLNAFDPMWDDKGVIVLLTGVVAAERMVTRKTDKAIRDNVMLALVNILEKTKNDRVLYFTAHALATITGQKLYTDAKFWRWWISIGGFEAAKDAGDGPTSAARKVPQFFEAPAVGKRVVFVIDVSGSMQWPVKMPPQPKPDPKPVVEKPKSPVTGGGSGGGDKKNDKNDKEPEAMPEPDPPDYSKVKIKLDLAKVELIYTLKQLPADYMFNVVIYDTPSDYIDPNTKSLVPASDANKNKFIKLVEGLKWKELTNIHGGLIDGYSITEKGVIKGDPAWDETALQCGAETIFFLTDGSPTYSDDSKKVDPKTQMGDGKFVNPENIVADIKRINTFRKVVINTVGIGPHYGPLLDALAQITGGTYSDRTGVAPK
ncbi:MAG: hypothetical protein IT462_11710 [Planctomycetes bacterium]|nr:hypothetical protein [Planctomycetota bacterium]